MPQLLVLLALFILSLGSPCAFSADSANAQSPVISTETTKSLPKVDAVVLAEERNRSTNAAIIIFESFIYKVFCFKCSTNESILRNSLGMSMRCGQ